MPAPINLWVTIIAMIASMVLGFIWYGPLFGKKWMELSGIKMPDKKPAFSTMIKPMLISFVGAILMSYLMTIAITISQSLGQLGFMCGFTIAFTNWLGFIVPIHLNMSGWEGKSWTLFFINTGYWLVFLLGVAATIVAII
jgi:hypothetical protein